MKKFNIDPIINEYEGNKDILLKKDPFLRSILPDYIIYNYQDLISKIDIDNFVKQMSILMNDIERINKDYGKLIIDFYKAKLQELYEIPDNVKFEIENDCDACMMEIEKDNIVENNHDNKRLEKEISHLMLINAMINGGALYNWSKIFTLIENDLESIEKGITDKIKNYINYALFFVYTNVPVKDELKPIIGYEQIKIEKDDGDKNKITIEAKGNNFIITTHEMLKGIYDVFSENSFPNELDEYSQKYLRKVCQNLYYEQWSWLYGSYFFKEHIDKKYNNEDKYYMYLGKLFKMKYEDLLNFLA